MDDRRRRVLLLGSTGFIGRHVASAFRASGDEVLDVARRAHPGPAPWRAVDLATGDLESLIAESGADVVVNCAGRTHGNRSELAHANVQLVARLLDALGSRGVRLLHLGSSAEYGRGGGSPTREDDVAAPLGPYGITKLAATELVRTSGLEAIVLRVFNPVGAGMPVDSMPGRAAHLVREAIAAGRPAIRMGDLSAERDFVDARDVADAVVAASRAGDPPPLVNIGTGRATRARELVRAIARAAEFDGEIHEDDAGSPRSAAVDRQVADVTLASQRLRWRATRSLEAAVAALWDQSPD